MSSSSAQIFETVPKSNHLGFFKEQTFRPKLVADYLSLSPRDLSKITGIAESSVRWDEKIPGPVKERLLEIANICELVAVHFEGNGQKTALWFSVPNPLLGNMSPRNMIRYGRYKRLLKFIQNALQGNHP